MLAGEWCREVHSELCCGHTEFLPVMGHSGCCVEEAARCTEYGSQEKTLCGNINLIVLNI